MISQEQEKREQYVKLIKHAKGWGFGQGLFPLDQMYTQCSTSEDAWFVAHAQDSLGRGFFLHYYGTDRSDAYTGNAYLQSIGAQTYLFSTEGVSDSHAQILESHFKLIPSVLVYSIFHEGIHVLLQDVFFKGSENNAGYSDRMILDQIDEGLAVYLGFELARLYIGQYLPHHLRLNDEYMKKTYECYSLIKKWVQIRRQNKNEERIKQQIRTVGRIVRNMENSGAASKIGALEMTQQFNGAYLALMKRYCWLLDDLKKLFAQTQITPFDFMSNPSQYRRILFDLAREKNKE